MTQEKIDQELQVKKQLTSMMVLLKEGLFNYIEYGVKDNPGGFLSLLRIRRTMTVGGFSFAIRQLHNYQEGSGQYFGDNEESITNCIDEAIKRVHTYHAPSPMREKLIALRKEKGIEEPKRVYEFFLGDDSPNSDFHIREARRKEMENHLQKLFPDAVTITL